MPEPKGTYRPVGNGMYEVTTANGAVMRMRVDPKKLDKAGFVRPSAAPFLYLTPQGWLNKKGAQTELMAGPKTSRQYVEDWWKTTEEEVNKPRTGTTTVEHSPTTVPPSSSPEPARENPQESPTEYVLTDKGIEPNPSPPLEVPPEVKQVRDADTKAMQDLAELQRRWSEHYKLQKGQYM